MAIRLEWDSLSGGEALDLSNWTDGVAFVRGASGLIGGPPIVSESEQVPFVPGAVWRSAKHGVRKIVLPIVAIDAGPEAVMALVRKMILLMDATLNVAILRVIHDTGQVSELNARIVEGLETQNLGADGPNALRASLVIEAVDPYWYGPTTIQSWNTSVEPAQWFPFPPLMLSSSNVVGRTTIPVSADVPVWPVWKIVGPGSNLSLTNMTTGEVLSFDDTAILAAGEALDIDTSPRGDNARTVIGPDGDNWFGKLDDHSLWPLVPGENEIDVQFASGSPDSYVSLYYRPAWLTP